MAEISSIKDREVLDFNRILVYLFFFLNHFCSKKDRDTSHKGRGATGTPGPPSFALALKKFISFLIRAVRIPNLECKNFVISFFLISSL